MTNGASHHRANIFPWDCEYYLEHGRMMEQDVMEQLARFDAIYLVVPTAPDHISLRDLLFVIRKGFDQYVNLPPVKLFRGVSTPRKDVEREDIDMVFVRENTEKTYVVYYIL